jgi:hypothetical protein
VHRFERFDAFVNVDKQLVQAHRRAGGGARGVDCAARYRSVAGSGPDTMLDNVALKDLLAKKF